MFKVIGYGSKKVYYSGTHSDCMKFINSKTKSKGDAKNHGTYTYFGFSEPLRIVEAESVKS